MCLGELMVEGCLDRPVANSLCMCLSVQAALVCTQEEAHPLGIERGEGMGWALAPTPERGIEFILFIIYLLLKYS